MIQATHDGSIESIVVGRHGVAFYRKDATLRVTPKEVLSALPNFQLRRRAADYLEWLSAVSDVVLAAIHAAKDWDRDRSSRLSRRSRTKGTRVGEVQLLAPLVTDRSCKTPSTETT